MYLYVPLSFENELLDKGRNPQSAMVVPLVPARGYRVTLEAPESRCWGHWLHPLVPVLFEVP
ncbi:MAG: hypothetical protein IJD52_05310 [Alphaproteobacteria bacterium]|nr:hypothetical protein [Alphaproteobacteria bacterium]